MDIDKLKNEYKKMRVSKMDVSLNQIDSMGDFIQKIKKQDRDDEKYILHNKMVPLFIGLFFLTLILIIVPVNTFPLLTGVFLIYTGFISTLIFLLMDYREITKESYDLNLLGYLKQKEERLKSWHATPVKYYWTFTIFVLGLIIFILGNTGFIREFGSGQVLLFIAIYLVLLIISWIGGEHFYRKRHRKKHQPLINSISELINELVVMNDKN